ncbi:acyl-CoA/acyl-ACP dehydrogenase [Leucobacter viscericola]|uniref:Acyl-CoA/acyl-ACP dehydrogenase n=1 Tax=Leucobacter viscericola TaxID=2714935 RepID=A0A6G7XE40_9MICO|nr:acyl-CoA dehydrogenase family protein [Leucobacter viscericola]QIK62813.1 acyl-CoA/acyl-ACP dehydrogenase [Leucobacter viscericola]
MTQLSPEEILPTSLLERFRERAAGYDSDNRFFAEDFAELRESGYLSAVVPGELGGSGISLETLVRCQRRLASFAPATALGVNMHLVWVQVARFLHERGIGTLDWVLRDAVAGEVFAFGISEAGNEAVLLDAFSTAEPDAEGGFRVSGTKVFTTLSPVWTRLGLHARCEEAGADPYLVFGFVRRDGGELEEGTIEHPGVWNPLGMRATQSWNTKLEGVRILPEDVAAKITPFDGSDPLVLAIFSSFSILTASVYAGIADRALELARQAANRPGAGGEGIRLDDPELASRLTSAVLDHRRSLDALTLLARDVDSVSEREDWFLALAAARNQVCDEARSAVDVAMRFAGSRGFQADSELARLYRDVLAGLFHPSSASALARTVRGSLAD